MILQTSGEEQGSRDASMGDFSPWGEAGLQEGQYGRLKTGREEQGSREAGKGDFSPWGEAGLQEGQYGRL